VLNRRPALCQGRTLLPGGTRHRPSRDPPKLLTRTRARCAWYVVAVTSPPQQATLSHPPPAPHTPPGRDRAQHPTVRALMNTPVFAFVRLSACVSAYTTTRSSMGSVKTADPRAMFPCASL